MSFSSISSIDSLNHLSSLVGVGTGLITICISSKTDLSNSIRMLTSELNTASNIKDKNNRKNVTTSLKSSIEKLKMQKTIPDNGLAIFAGSCI
jgi:peptide subunit release factor 1 (eRF1)